MWRPSKATTCFIFCYFLSLSTSTAQKIGSRPTPPSSPSLPSLPLLTHCSRQLLVGCCVSPSNGSRATAAVCFFHFLSLNLPPQTMEKRPPTFCLICISSQTTPQSKCHLLIDCCIYYLIDGHVRLGPHPSFYFLMGPVSAPQVREPAAAIPKPPPDAFTGLMGSCGTVIWGQCKCCHGVKWQKEAACGRAAMAHLVVFV